MTRAKQAATGMSVANNQGPETPPAQARENLTVKQLAKAVLAGKLRPRAADVRRLAEAVLSRKVKGKKAKSDKLAKIPRPKKK